MAEPQGPRKFDLDELLSEIRERESAGVFTPDGKVLAWVSSFPQRKDKEQQHILALSRSLISVAETSGLSALDRVWIDGVARKILLQRTPKKGLIVALVGAPAMNIGLAWMNMKQVALAADEALGKGT